MLAEESAGRRGLARRMAEGYERVEAEAGLFRSSKSTAFPSQDESMFSMIVEAAEPLQQPL